MSSTKHDSVINAILLNNSIHHTFPLSFTLYIQTETTISVSSYKKFHYHHHFQCASENWTVLCSIRCSGLTFLLPPVSPMQNLWHTVLPINVVNTDIDMDTSKPMHLQVGNPKFLIQSDKPQVDNQGAHKDRSLNRGSHSIPWTYARHFYSTFLAFLLTKVMFLKLNFITQLPKSNWLWCCSIFGGKLYCKHL